MHTYETNGHVEPRLNHYDSSGKYREKFTGDKFSSEMFADAAIAFLKNRRTANNRFLLTWPLLLLMILD